MKISFQRARQGRAMGTPFCLFLAHVIACICFCCVATAQPQRMQMYDASGKPLGGQRETVIVKVTGTVLDADTHQPLAVFFVTPGALDRDRTTFDWEEPERVSFSGGAFTLNVNRERLPPAVLVEAPGYLPQRSQPIRSLETNVTFALKKGEGPTGVVLTPEGKPASGRTVYFSRLKDLLRLEGPTLTPRKVSSRLRSTVTDAAGRFSFTPDLDGFSVVVADDAGFADVRLADLKASAEVRLQPWARVEGTLKIGARLGTNETVGLASAFAPMAYYPRPMPPFTISADAQTDASGHFVFPRVPPTDVKIYHAPKIGNPDLGLTPITQVTNVTLQPGETRAIIVGGEGRPVVGRVAFKNYTKPVEWQEQLFWMDSQSPEPADCPNFDAISKEYHASVAAAKTQADMDTAENRYLAEHDRIARQLSAYYATPEGRQYWFSKRTYVLAFASDGTFHIDDVPPGIYELTLDPRELMPKMGQIKSPLIASLRQEVTVPESSGPSDLPYDLGVVKMLARVNQGDVAPEFAVKTMDDKTVRLSDYKGKYVLLNFWAISNALTSIEMSDLKDTFAEYRTNARVAMIGLNVDPDFAAAREFAAKNQLDWPQGRIGAGPNKDLPDRFGIDKIPFVTLVDPQGRVLASGLRGGTIQPTLESILAGPQ